MLYRISYSVLVFVLSMILLFLTKPSIAFNNEGKLRKFGVNDKGSTIYSVGVLTTSLAIVTFYLFCVIDIIFD